jgi:hypothetical protein
MAGVQAKSETFDKIRDLQRAVTDAQIKLGDYIAHAHDDLGYSWGLIGHALGTSRQGAWQKYSSFTNQGDLK